MMREAQTIGEKLGVHFRVSLEKRINGAQAVGQHKTSMLQDVELGRPIELEALVGLGDRARQDHRNPDAQHRCGLCTRVAAGEKIAAAQSDLAHVLNG